MKKNLLRIFCIVLALTMLVGLMPVLAAEDDVTVYVSVSEQGVLAETKDGAPAAQLEVAVPAGSTLEDAIIAAHEAYCPDGAEGWETAESDWGLSMAKIWGKTDGVGAWYLNGVMPMDQSWNITATDGDYVDLILYREDWSDSYAAFDQRAAEAAAGEAITLALTHDVFDENFVASPEALAGAAVKLADGTELGVTDEEGKIALTFDEVGTYLVTAEDPDLAITAPVCVITVAEAAAPAPAAEDITVYVSVSDQGVPAQTKDGKPAAQLAVKVADGSTVEAAIIAAHEAYCPDGAEGWEMAESDWGLSMVKIWGKTDGVGAWYLNGVMPMEQSNAVTASDGDYVDLILYGPDWSDSYACFDKRTAAAATGEAVTLTLTHDVFDENFVASPEALAGAAVKLADGTELGVTDAEGKVTVSFNEAGTYLVTAEDPDLAITAPLCVITVTGETIVPAEPEQPAEPEAPAEPEQPAEPEASAYQNYTVKAGDTLWSIAKKFMGSGFRWGELFQLNADLVKNPRMIYVGQVLRVPA